VGVEAAVGGVEGVVAEAAEACAEVEGAAEVIEAVEGADT
jgi:hypothetical protein